MEKPGILTVTSAIAREDLIRLVRLYFQDMVKLVVDVKRGAIAVGGELHADAEALLLGSGSAQVNLWGANYYPGRGPDGCLEYTALINIRPAQGNPGMELEDAGLQARVREVTFALIGKGEPLE